MDTQALAQSLKDVRRVLVSKGKKLLHLDPSVDEEQILSAAIGRSGNLRAPSLRYGELLIVGFNEEAYGELA